MSNDPKLKDKNKPTVKDSINTLSPRNSLFKEKFPKGDFFQGNESVETDLNEMSVNEDDLRFYEALGLQHFLNDRNKTNLFADNTFNFATLHAILNAMVRHLGRITSWFNRREHIIEMLCAEFDGSDDFNVTKPRVQKLSTNTFKTRDSQPMNQKTMEFDYDTLMDEVDSVRTDADKELSPSDRIPEEKPEEKKPRYPIVKTQSLITKDKETPRIHRSSEQNKNDFSKTLPNIKDAKKDNNKARNVEPTAQMETLLKDTVPTIRDAGKNSMFLKQMNVIKNTLKTEVYQDLKNLVDMAYGEHAAMVQVTQIQKIPENKTDALREEIGELRALISALKSQGDVYEKKIAEFDRSLPEMKREVDKLNIEVYQKASKDDYLAITSHMPNLATRNDLDLLREYMNDKTDSQETNEIKISIQNLKEDLNGYCLSHEFNKKVRELEEATKRVAEAKANKELLTEKIADVTKQIVENGNKLIDYKAQVKETIDTVKKNIRKLEGSLEAKAERDVIWEIREKMRDLVEKQELLDLEDKVFPLMKDVVSSTTIFDEKIEETRRQMLRFDEVISDKASKYDMVNIQKKLTMCLEKVDFDQEVEKQAKINDFLEVTVKKHTEQLFEKGETITHTAAELLELTQDVILLKEKQSEVITSDDLSEVREKIDSKADRVDIAQLYDLKSNKADITSLVLSLDYVHKQLEYQAMISVSTLNSMVYGMQERSEELVLRTRTILLRHATNVCNWINLWTVGDAYRNGKKEVPNELLTFDDYAEQTMKDVRSIFEKMKENKLYNGNKGFRKSVYSEGFNNRSNTPTPNRVVNLNTTLPKLK